MWTLDIALHADSNKVPPVLSRRPGPDHAKLKRNAPFFSVYDIGRLFSSPEIGFFLRRELKKISEEETMKIETGLEDVKYWGDVRHYARDAKHPWRFTAANYGI